MRAITNERTYNILLENMVFATKSNEVVDVKNFYDPCLYSGAIKTEGFDHDLVHLLEFGFIYYVDDFGNKIKVSDLGRNIVKDRLGH